jgi:hypothetical protein
MHVDNSALWFITVISNPIQFQIRFALYHRFRRHILDELRGNLLTVECALEGHDFGATQSDLRAVNEIQVQVRNKSVLWLKENLANIAVQHLPPDCLYICFCDADIFFKMDDLTLLPELLIKQLHQYPMVQPWSLAHDLGPDGNVMEIHKSFAWFAHNQPDTFYKSLISTTATTVSTPSNSKNMPSIEISFPYRPARGSFASLNRKWHPGYASAFRRSVLEEIGGFFEKGLLGSGDFHMMMSIYNKAHLTIIDGVHPNYRRAVLQWQQRVQKATSGHFGYLDVTILHAFHGFKKNRQYLSRRQILVDEQFDPETFVYKNEDGVWELHDIKKTQQFKERVIQYFKLRKEDVAISKA